MKCTASPFWKHTVRHGTRFAQASTAQRTLRRNASSAAPSRCRPGREAVAAMRRKGTSRTASDAKASAGSASARRRRFVAPRGRRRAGEAAITGAGLGAACGGDKPLPLGALAERWEPVARLAPEGAEAVRLSREFELVAACCRRPADAAAVARVGALAEG